MSGPTDEHAIRVAYDRVAVDYERLLSDHHGTSPFDQAMLQVFADLVAADGGGPVADLGCGPGRITGPLHSLGLDVFGVDLSPAMVQVARARHPTLRFDVGSMAALHLSDGELAGVVAWYSIIHTAPAGHPVLFAELHRVLRPGGRLIVAFQVGDEEGHLTHAYGHDVALDVHRLDPDRVAIDLEQAGFAVTARLVRSADGDLERHPQAYLVARAEQRNLGPPPGG